MIYILAGNDIKKKSAHIKSLAKNQMPVVIEVSALDEDILKSYASSASMFGDSPIIVVENFLKDTEVNLSPNLLEDMDNSPTTFIFTEDKLLVTDEKKYKKYGTILRFDEKQSIQTPKFNPFKIADAFGHQDKIGAWTLYRQAIDSGVEPEPISGMLFWKIKTMIMGGDKTVPIDTLKKWSSELVSLYHRAHRGECDFVLGLEQFILISLTRQKEKA